MKLIIAFFTMALSFGEVQLKGCANQQGNTYCVNPEESQDCPDSCCPTDRCHTLMHYVANGTFNKSLDNTTFVFFTGEHQLQQVIYIQDVSNLKFQSKQNGDRSDVTVKCNSRSQAGLDFSYISNLTIEGLKVTDCRYCINATYCSAVQMFRVTNLFMTSVVISNTVGVGLTLHSLDGNSLINKTVIQNSSGVNGRNLALYCANEDQRPVSNIHIYNSTIQHGYQKNKYYNKWHNPASGVFIHIACDITMNITLEKLKVMNNQVESQGKGGNIAIEYISFSKQWPVSISIIDCFIAHGYSILGGGLYFNALRIPNGWNDSVLDNVRNQPSANAVQILTVRGTLFLENESVFGAGVYVRFNETKWPEVAKISFENCHFEKQRLHQDEAEHGGVAIHIRNFQLPVYVPHTRPLLEIEFSNCNFTNNIPTTKAFPASFHTEETHNGVLFIQGIESATLSGCMFVSNNCSGIVLVQSLLTMRGENIIHNNTGVRGGGMVLCSRSIIFLHENLTLNISENRAKEFGGGIYVESECDQDVPHCFFQVNDTSTIFTRVSLVNNTALAGEAIYGGMVDHCIIYQNIDYEGPTKRFNEIFHIKPQRNSAISSNPTSICFCSNETFINVNDTCLKNQTITSTIVPGSTIRMLVMLFGQRFGTAPGIVKAYIDCEQNNDCWLSEYQDIKETIQNTSICTEVEYTIHSGSDNINGTLTLVVKGSSFEYSRGQLKYDTANIRLRIEKCKVSGHSCLPCLQTVDWSSEKWHLLLKERKTWTHTGGTITDTEE